MEETTNAPSARPAIYMRSATNNLASLAEQEKKCRAAAEKLFPGVSISADHVFTEGASSVMHRSGRPALAALLRKADEKPRLFDVVIAASACRLGRSLSTVWAIFEALKSNGIGIHFANNGLDAPMPELKSLLAASRPPEEYVSVLNGYIPLDSPQDMPQQGHSSVEVLRSPHCNGHRVTTPDQKESQIPTLELGAVEGESDVALDHVLNSDDNAE